MQKIESFLAGIASARKKTGVLHATEDFEAAIKSCLKAGYTLTEAESQFDVSVFLTDDELLTKIKAGTNQKQVLCIGVETFIGPRLSDGDFVEQFVKKLLVEEPPQPLIILLYSRRLFRIFARLYSLHLPNQIHALDLTTPELTDDENA